MCRGLAVQRASVTMTVIPYLPYMVRRHRFGGEDGEDVAK